MPSRGRRVDHRQPLDVVAVERPPPARLASGPTVIAGALISSTAVFPGALARIAGPTAVLQQPAVRGSVGVFLFEEQVGLGDDPDHSSVGVQDRHGADAAVGQQLGYLRGVCSSTVMMSPVMTWRS
jgi:hypothetical protein